MYALGTAVSEASENVLRGIEVTIKNYEWYHYNIQQKPTHYQYYDNCCHTFATLLHNKNVDPLDIQFLMGHKDFKMSAKYTHAQIDRLKNAVNLL